MAPYHHIVPRFYLAHFAESSLIKRVELKYGADRKKSIRKVGGVEGFYSIPDADNPEIYENDLFGPIETKAAPIFKKIIEQNYWLLSQPDRATIANFLAIQFLRGIDRRNEQSEMATALSRLKTAASGRNAFLENLQDATGEADLPTDLEEVWNACVGPDTLIEATASFHMNQLVAELPNAVLYVAARPWILVPFERKHLLTCDTPVSLAPHHDSPSFVGVGLANAYYILFPISRQFGLILSNTDVAREASATEMMLGATDFTLAGSAKLARLFNSFSVGSARDYIFYHPADEDLVPDPIPERRTHEMQANGFDELIAELVAQGGLSPDHRR